MTTLVQISINLATLNISHNNYDFGKRPIKCYTLTRTKIGSFHQNGPILRRAYYRERWSFFGGSRGKDGILVKEEEEEEEWKRKKRVIEVRFNQGFGFNGGGGGGGGGRDNGATARLLGNLALAVGLTYLSVTGQLGWLLDAIVSIWLLAFLLPIVGLGAFLWWAGRDMVQGTCPNCGNDFQTFKSSIRNDLQLCPFCSQPFSVVGDEFVRDSVKFSNQSSTFRQAFNGFSPGSKKGKDPSTAVVDVEAEIKDAD